MIKNVWTVLLLLALTVGFSGISHASSNYLAQFNAKYGTTGTALDTCILCHGLSGPPNDPYGSDFAASSKGNHSFNKTLEDLDSDGDGFTNIVEINARTFPGNKNSKPATSDTAAPTVTGFTIPATSSSLVVSITTFTATDTVGVTGYMVTESATAPAASATGWSATAPTSYPFTTAGSKTLYAWAKDAAGNVSSSLSASVNISTASPGPGPSGGMTIWVGQWFKITTKITGSCSGSSGMVSDSGSSVGYLKLWNWDDTNQILQADYYEYDTATAQWSSQSLPLVFIAGSNLDFLCQSQVIDNAANSTDGFTARIVGKETGGVLKRATFKSLGGYYIDTLDQFGAIANCAGGLKLTGALIAESKVPVPSNILSH